MSLYSDYLLTTVPLVCNTSFEGALSKTFRTPPTHVTFKFQFICVERDAVLLVMISRDNLLKLTAL